jgi:hypothetical protein
VKFLIALRRDATGIDFLNGRILKRLSHTESKTELNTSADWYACMADMFNLRLSDVDGSAKSALWKKVTTAHEQQMATTG